MIISTRNCDLPESISKLHSIQDTPWPGIGPGLTIPHFFVLFGVGSLIHKLWVYKKPLITNKMKIKSKHKEETRQVEFKDVSYKLILVIVFSRLSLSQYIFSVSL